MYTSDKENQLIQLLTPEGVESFLTTLRTTAEEDSSVGRLADDVEEEWRKLGIAKRNGMMDDEQIYFALTAFFKKASATVLRSQETSDS